MNEKIFLAVPIYKEIEPEANDSINALYKNSSYPIQYGGLRGHPNIYMRHTNMCKNFLKSDCTHYLWYDTDQVMLDPPNWIEKLVEADKDIISPLIVKRRYPYLPACVNDEQSKAIQKGQVPPLADYRKYGNDIFPIKYCCGGVVLIKRIVLESFKNPFYPEFNKTGGLMGVDISLYEKARRKGFRCWIDPSIKCGHLSMYPNLPEDYYQILDSGGLDQWSEQNQREYNQESQI